MSKQEKFFLLKIYPDFSGRMLNRIVTKGKNFFGPYVKSRDMLNRVYVKLGGMLAEFKGGPTKFFFRTLNRGVC
jgi:hypothetical protein